MHIYIALLIHFYVSSQDDSNTISGVSACDVKSLDGKTVSAKDFSNDGNPIIICFWKSCCNSALKFMEAMNDIYDDLIDEYSIKVFIISKDDSQSSSKERPLINGQGWEFELEFHS